MRLARSHQSSYALWRRVGDDDHQIVVAELAQDDRRSTVHENGCPWFEREVLAIHHELTLTAQHVKYLIVREHVDTVRRASMQCALAKYQSGIYELVEVAVAVVSPTPWCGAGSLTITSASRFRRYRLRFAPGTAGGVHRADAGRTAGGLARGPSQAITVELRNRRSAARSME